MIRSDSPPEYASALSKKLTPASPAASMHSTASPVSSCGPKVTHEPNDSTLTLRPVRPSRRYSISIVQPLSSVGAEARHRRPWSRPSGQAHESGPAGSHEPTRPDGLDPDRPAAARGVDDVAVADVDPDVIGGATRAPEDEVAGLHGRQRDARNGVVLLVGRAGDGDPGLAPRPLGEPGAVETVPWAFSSPLVGDADLALGRLHGAPAGAVGWRVAERGAGQRRPSCRRLLRGDELRDLSVERAKRRLLRAGRRRRRVASRRRLRQRCL